MQNKLYDALGRPSLLVGLLLAALWPHWLWMARRAVDGSDEPWGIVALATLAGLAWLERRHIAARPSGAVLAAAGGLALAAAASVSLLPPIIGGALAMTAVFILLAGLLPPGRPRLPLLILALLVLPLAASLNFYIGYPLRWLCAWGSAQLLSLTGVHATAEGAALIWNGKTILVDAPCAGIAMLWVGIYAAALLSYLHRAATLRVLVNLLVAGVVVVAGNTLRNTVLFFKEAGITRLPDWTHDGIGLAIFALSFLLIYYLLSWRPHARR